MRLSQNGIVSEWGCLRMGLSQNEAVPNLSDVAVAMFLHEVLIQVRYSGHTIVRQQLNTLLENQSNHALNSQINTLLLTNFFLPIGI